MGENQHSHIRSFSSSPSSSRVFLESLSRNRGKRAFKDRENISFAQETPSPFLLSLIPVEVCEAEGCDTVYYNIYETYEQSTPILNEACELKVSVLIFARSQSTTHPHNPLLPFRLCLEYRYPLYSSPSSLPLSIWHYRWCFPSFCSSLNAFSVFSMNCLNALF